MSTLLSTIDKQPPAIYYTARFRQMVEDHLTIIKTSANNTTRIITEDDMATLYRYVGDFYGFLSAIPDNPAPQYHWVIMRMNGFRSRFDLTTDITQLIFPDWDFIDQLAQLSKEKK